MDWLPDELLLQFFDGSSIAELCALSRVSSRWRSIARSHPTFWRSVSIREWEVSRGALPTFLERVRQCPEAPLDIEFDFDLDVPKAVLDAVRANLQRATSIRMSSREENWPLSTFDVPAPRLRRLEMSACQRSHHSPAAAAPATTTIFAGQAPQLRSVKFADLIFWLDLSAVVKFPAVVDVDVSFSSAFSSDLPADMFDRLARLFPHMQSLVVNVFDYAKGQPARRFYASPLSDAASETFAGLKQLELWNSPACAATLSKLPVEAIPSIALFNNIFNEPEVIRVLLPFAGDVCLSYDRCDARSGSRKLVMSVLDGDRRLQRTLEASDGESLYSANMMRASMSTRLVALSIDKAAAWYSLITAVDILPALRVLRLAFSGDQVWSTIKSVASPVSYERSIRCPSLRTWVLHTDGEVVVWPSALVEKLFTAVVFLRRCADLQLHNVVLLDYGEGSEALESAATFGFKDLVVTVDPNSESWFDGLI
ncbi:hypothetical protein EXIGLDRAFT_718656 [Exidia glandulosa HHB12029]|uniref:F-box domain-containing protein n=1 Tax=Exidia glandulosa HHB12029 TaxID=1314781 RepID=A0A165HM03_EXIGL|nr:hypothetical protein EXIGLDRAFT_718656 [Exidia glandulosa HHB12029]